MRAPQAAHFALDVSDLFQRPAVHALAFPDDLLAHGQALHLVEGDAHLILGERFFLFAFAFTINPLISVMGVFAALVLFIMYFKIPYAVLVGREQKRFPAPRALTGITLVLVLLCIVFGVVPHLQLWILTGAI